MSVRQKISSVKIVNDSVNNENCKNVPSEDFWSENQETCGVINVWSESGQSDEEEY